MRRQSRRRSKSRGRASRSRRRTKSRRRRKSKSRRGSKRRSRRRSKRNSRRRSRRRSAVGIGLGVGATAAMLLVAYSMMGGKKRKTRSSKSKSPTTTKGYTRSETPLSLASRGGDKSRETMTLDGGYSPETRTRRSPRNKAALNKLREELKSIYSKTGDGTSKKSEKSPKTFMTYLGDASKNQATTSVGSGGLTPTQVNEKTKQFLSSAFEGAFDEDDKKGDLKARTEFSGQWFSKGKRKALSVFSGEQKTYLEKKLKQSFDNKMKSYVISGKPTPKDMWEDLLKRIDNDKRAKLKLEQLFEKWPQIEDAFNPNIN